MTDAGRCTARKALVCSQDPNPVQWEGAPGQGRAPTPHLPEHHFWNSCSGKVQAVKPLWEVKGTRWENSNFKKEKHSARDVKGKAAVGEMRQQTGTLGHLAASLRHGKHSLRPTDIHVCWTVGQGDAVGPSETPTQGLWCVSTLNFTLFEMYVFAFLWGRSWFKYC